MCGIIFVDGKTPEQARIATRLQFKNQISRGVQGFGIVEVKPNIKKPKIHRALHTNPAMDALDSVKSSSVLFHHRIPTSTGNTLKGTHPFRVQARGRKMFVIHNGVLQNEDDVLEKLDVKPESLSSYQIHHGNKYTYNDSEALALDFIDALVNGRKELHSTGSIALMAYEPALNCVWMYRNSGNPLKVFNEGGVFMAASEAPSSEGSIKEQSLYKYDLLKKKFMHVRALRSLEYVSWSESYGHYYKRGTVGAERDEAQDYENWADDNDVRYEKKLKVQGQEGWIAPGTSDYLNRLENRKKAVASKFDVGFTGGRTDLTSPNEQLHMLDGAPLFADSKLGLLLVDKDARQDFLDELTFPDTEVTDIQDTQDMDHHIDRIRNVGAMIEELWVEHPKHQWLGCDKKAFTFLLARLRQLMWTYQTVKNTFDYHIRKEQWIQDAITEARGTLLAMANLEQAWDHGTSARGVTRVTEADAEIKKDLAIISEVKAVQDKIGFKTGA